MAVARFGAGKSVGLAFLLVLLVMMSTSLRWGFLPQTVYAVDMRQAIVQTHDGLVRGNVYDGWRTFEAIPYAAPPVGPLRFHSPQPMHSWEGIRSGEVPGPWCIQLNEFGDGVDPRSSEDCLTLNVWTPTHQNGSLLPVMVWIHGGSFVRGSGDVYQARSLVQHNPMIVVTINYRLGALGFLADPGLGDKGNYGLEDQQAALRWVRDNIAAFGGDPFKVTIAGESAGATSVCDHLVSPGSSGLFRAAIIQSGPCQGQVDRAHAEGISRKYSADVGCGSRKANRVSIRECLEKLPAHVFSRPLWYSHFGSDSLSGPVIGDSVLPYEPMGYIAQGNVAKVPILIGTTHDEFTFLEAARVLQTKHMLTSREYARLLVEEFGVSQARVIQQHYPLDRYANASVAYSALGTDAVFSCVAYRIVNGLVRSGHAVYAYEFADLNPPVAWPFNRSPFPLKAGHSFELRYLFDMGDAPGFSDEQLKLSGQMMRYWGGFVEKGVPGQEEMMLWPDVGEDDRWFVFRPEGNLITTDFSQEHQCDLWSHIHL